MVLFQSLSEVSLTLKALTTISMKKFSGPNLSSVLQIFVTMCWQFLLKIPSLSPTYAKPKLSSFHQVWHFFVLFLFLSIIIYFPHFSGCVIYNRFWLFASCSEYLYHRHCLSPPQSHFLAFFLTIEIFSYFFCSIRGQPFLFYRGVNLDKYKLIVVFLLP